jgi:predicted enzyme related to lactoylglutathione lyase
VKLTLYVVRVFVTDWDRALRFYTETLGPPYEGAEGPLVGRFVGVSLRVDDIDETYQTLRGRGVEFVAPPARMPWGGVLAHFRDPDGNVLTLLVSPS